MAKNPEPRTPAEIVAEYDALSALEKMRHPQRHDIPLLRAMIGPVDPDTARVGEQMARKMASGLVPLDELPPKPKPET